MLDMTPAELYALASADPTTATAVATVAFVDATATLASATTYLVYATYGLVAVGLGQIASIVYGIRTMTRSGKLRAEEHDKRHQETMEQLRQSGKALDALIRRTQPRNRRRATLRPSP